MACAWSPPGVHTSRRSSRCVSSKAKNLTR